MSANPNTTEIIAENLKLKEEINSLQSKLNLLKNASAISKIDEEVEQTYIELIENTNDSLLVLQDGLIKFVNTATCEMFGFQKEELINLDIKRFIYSEDVDYVIYRYKGNLKGQRFDRKLVFRIKSKSKEISWVEANSANLKWENKQALLLFLKDITSEIKEEEKVAQVYNLLNLTGDMAKVGGWEFEVPSMKGKWTRQVAIIHGMDPDSDTNVDIGLSFYEPESRIKIEQAIDLLLKNGTPYDLELPLVTKNGDKKWIRTKGFPVYSDGAIERVQGIFQDITQLKEAENQLYEESNLIRTLFNTIPYLIWLKDENGKYVTFNYRFEELIGMSLDQVIGKNDYDLFPKEAADAFRANDQLAIDKNASTKNLEDLTFASNGYAGTFETIKTPVFDDEGIFRGVLGLSHDVSSVIAAERQLKKSNEILEERVIERTKELNDKTIQLEVVNKDLEAFAYSISHDLRAPLRHIDGFASILLKSDEIKQGKSAHYLSKISESSIKMSKMIEALLSFSRLGRKPLNKKDVDLNKIVNSIVNQIKAEYPERNIKWEIDQLPIILGDESLMEMVFVNLISNAVKFTSKKHEAIIQVKYQKLDDGAVEISVQDNGVGFDMNYSNKLFGVFQRLHLDKEFAGTGIGLANVKQIITKHGGTITVDAAVDKGATFKIILS